MFIVKYRKIFFALSLITTILSFLAMYFYGFNFGIDFTGGSIVGVEYLEQRPNVKVVRESLENIGVSNFILSPVGQKSISIKMKEITQEEKNAIIFKLSDGGNIPLKEEKFNSIGPAVGNELKQKSYIAIAVVLLCILLFIMFSFRRMEKPFNYGLATILALAHDVVVPTGAYIAFIKFYGGEIDLLFVSAILAILGYSVHDTIVVFDRVRENKLSFGNKLSFEDVVSKSVSETFGRSINTSVTIFLALLSLYFIGGETTKNFALVLLIGVVAGTYSSIFLASPLLVTLSNLREKIAKK